MDLTTLMGKRDGLTQQIKKLTAERDGVCEDIAYLMKSQQRERTAACQEHHYIPTNTKWQSVSQVRCQFCGDTRN